MIKAIFMDYTGTMVQEDEPYTRGLTGSFSIVLRTVVLMEIFPICMRCGERYGYMPRYLMM